MRPPLDFCWDSVHHGYMGAIVIIFGYYAENEWIMLLGALLLFDDIVEHTITQDTPFRILYEKTIKNMLPKCCTMNE